MTSIVKNFIGALCLLFAIVMLVMSFRAFDMKIATYYPDETYGGDAYTGIQNAMASTAERVSNLNNTVAYVGGGVLLSFSFGFLAVAVYLFVTAVTPSAGTQHKSYSDIVRVKKVPSGRCDECKQWCPELWECIVKRGMHYRERNMCQNCIELFVTR